MRNILRHVRDQARDEQDTLESSRPEASWSSNHTTLASATAAADAAPESTQAVRGPASHTARGSRNAAASGSGFRNFDSRMLSHLQNYPPPQGPQPVHIGEPVAGMSDAHTARMNLHETGDRLAQVNEDLRSLLAQPLPSSDLTRRRSEDDDGSSSRGHKRRRLDATSPPKAYYPIKYGNQGQVVSGRLNMQLVSTDGGIVSPSAGEVRWSRSTMHEVHDKYAAANVLRDDTSVYCTRSSHCNMVFQHQGQTAFTLEKLVIKAPKTGFTDPVQEGLVFTALHQDAVFEATKRYHIWHYDSSRFGHLFKSRRLHRTRAPLGRRMTHSTPPPPTSHIRAQRQTRTAAADDVWPESPLSDDDLSDSSSGHSDAPHETHSLRPTAHGLERDDLDDTELDLNAYNDLVELTRRGDLAAASRHPSEPTSRQTLDAFTTRLQGNDTSQPRARQSSQSWWDRANAVDATLDAMSANSRRVGASLRGQEQDMSAGFAAARRDLEAARAHLGELHRAITDGGSGGNSNDYAMDAERLGFDPPIITSSTSDRFRERLIEHSETVAAWQRAADAARSPPDTSSGTSTELLVPDARFSMHRHFSNGRHAPYEHSTSFTRSEARAVPPAQPTGLDKFRPRSVDVVDEHFARPAQGLGSVLRSETAGSGERVDYVHVRTTQIVQKDNEMTISFDPPISAKVILLKLWNPKAGGGEPDGKRNIDIQSIEAIGWAGPRWFPAVGMR